MSRITEVFKKCKAENRAAIMPFLTAGFPSEKTFLRLLRTLIASGADMIEIGIPFSDPLADGRSIQYSSQTALKNGASMQRTIQLLAEMGADNEVPLILMSYYNPIHTMGRARFARKAQKAGVQGLIVPDVVLEEGKAMETICKENGLDLIYLLAPTSTDERRSQIIRRSSGFVYLVSLIGVTGARRKLPRHLNYWIRQVKKESPLPICVGFGISDHRQAREISRVADGVIIGSAIVEIIRKSDGASQMINDVGRFISQLKERV